MNSWEERLGEFWLDKEESLPGLAVSLDNIKDFIRQELNSQREELVGMIEERREPEQHCEYCAGCRDSKDRMCWRFINNQLLDDLKRRVG